MAESLSNDNNTCVVCFKNVVFFSIGECDHPVCFECSTRMRVLCLQNECPICRGGLERVVFTDSIQPYKSLRNKTFSERLFERQYKIGFCNEEIKNAYEKLLENCCKLCDNIPPFRTFTMLSEHMRKIHEKYYCDLCVKHLKIFTSERKCYSRHELAHHRRKGDLDDTSHRGHPLCEFCEERFMDADELYRHLRKEHLYCHLCDADGRNLYYSSHQALAHHFRTDHYLCEEGECAGQHLTAVFRSEIDLKAHRATVHGRGMTRGAARQARTLELQFNITPHPVVQRAPRDRERERERERERAEPVIPPAPAPAPEQRIDTRSDEHFPRLSAAPAAPHLVLGPASSRPYRGESGNLARNDRNFPALDGGASRPGVAATPTSAPRPAAPVAAAILRNSKPSVSIQLHSQPASASNFRLTQASGSRISIPPQQKRSALSDDDFPSLGIAKDDHPNIGASTVQPPKVTLINSQEMSAMKHTQHNNQPKKPQLSSEAFPALSASSTPTTPPKWITVSKSKEKNKPSKPEPPPQPKEISFNQVADFPTLPINNSKSKSKKSPQPNQVINNQSEIKNKKEKKKNNNAKKENISDLNIVNGANYKNNVKIHYEAATSESIPNNKIEKKIKTVDTPSGTVTSEKRNGTGDYKMASKDYPPLNPKSDDCPPLNMKIENYPPSNPRSENLTKKIPNGSGSPGSKPRPPCDGMTFTNSSGQTFSAPVHTYIPPTNFEHRNRALVNKFVSALGSADALESFKVASRAFRDSILNADEFYEHCQKAMGTEFESLFPELVALLPDIAKQQELVVGRKVPQLDVCSTCGQLLAPCDKIGHDTAHWPPLGR